MLKKLLTNSFLLLQVVLAFGQTVEVSSGKVQRFEKFPSKFIDARNIDIWLPEGYRPDKKYAVLYMHDGQMLYDSTTTWNKQEWGVDETLGKLIADQRIEPCIVVGIWNSPNEGGRYAEYFPQRILDSIPADIRETILRDQIKGVALADRYLKFMVQELKPYIDKHFATKKGRKHTFVMGSSMGGLISAYALCEYPSVFGGAACLSTHTPIVIPSGQLSTTMVDLVAGAFRNYLSRKLPQGHSFKIYFDYGTETLDALYKPYQTQIDAMMKSKGFTSKTWVTREFPGTDHSEKAWRERLTIPVMFLLQKK
ncbi:MAG: esterase family protein [Saprospiraceae bacterium]|nr:esterase family protein [Saprospiraceae bacterium]